MESKPSLSADAWKQHVAACEHAGGSLHAYAQAHGLCRQTLGRWRQRLRPKAAEPLTLLPVRVVSAAAPAGGATLRLELALARGTTLRVEGAVEPAWVATLCRALEAG